MADPAAKKERYPEGGEEVAVEKFLGRGFEPVDHAAHRERQDERDDSRENERHHGRGEEAAIGREERPERRERADALRLLAFRLGVRRCPGHWFPSHGFGTHTGRVAARQAEAPKGRAGGGPARAGNGAGGGNRTRVISLEGK